MKIKLWILIALFEFSTSLFTSCQRCMICSLVDSKGEVLETYAKECKKRKELKDYRKQCRTNAQKLDIDCDCKLFRPKQAVVK